MDTALRGIPRTLVARARCDPETLVVWDAGVRLGYGFPEAHGWYSDRQHRIRLRFKVFDGATAFDRPFQAYQLQGSDDYLNATAFTEGQEETLQVERISRTDLRSKHGIDGAAGADAMRRRADNCGSQRRRGYLLQRFSGPAFVEGFIKQPATVQCPEDQLGAAAFDFPNC